ncbi:ATP synthase subunit I [Zavarzinia compransoris]|uniref:ATP synthase subunit I n=1 Tax=Zavarzinia marina TaxID=2911065 RepID=UPI001F370F91|nr:ATP synthase subunit I [Zavarzinia marina]MCF4167603.1 ATP synthase subunit I [Zavarzinia marina]
MDGMTTIANGDPLLTVLVLVAALVGGVLAGVLYFKGLLWQVRRYSAGGRLPSLLGLMALRFLLLAGMLGAAAFAGALPLLVAVLGVMAGRFLVMRRVREMPT